MASVLEIHSPNNGMASATPKKGALEKIIWLRIAPK